MGRARRGNEDNLFCCGAALDEASRDMPFSVCGETGAPAVFAVCDGMGGELAGERASLAAVQALADFDGRLRGADSARLDALVCEYVAEANRRIRLGAGETKAEPRAAACAEWAMAGESPNGARVPPCNGEGGAASAERAVAGESPERPAPQERPARTGSTLALAVVARGELRAYNIGDSRVYVLDGAGLRLLSADHTLAMAKVRAGLLTEEQARRSGEWSKLTACLGIASDDGTEFSADISPPVPLSGRMRLLLCSDGLTDMAPDERIGQILRSAKNVRQAAQELMSEALNSGGADNVTLIVADIRAKASWKRRA
jgi:protein phosphatase